MVANGGADAADGDGEFFEEFEIGKSGGNITAHTN